MNFQEIKKKLKELGIEPADLANGWESFVDDIDESELSNIEIFGTAIFARDHSDLYDQIRMKFAEIFGKHTITRKRTNDDVEVIVYFEDHDVYIKLSGYYSSYSGDNLEDAIYRECLPVVKTIVVYEYV